MTNLNKKLIVLMCMILFSFAFVSAAQSNLGVFKRGECVDLIQTCSNCTYNNISSVKYPNSTIAISNISMSKISSVEYTYNFCNTSLAGEYIVSGYGDPSGTTQIWVYSFDITPTGFLNTLGFYILILLLSIGIIVFGFSINDGWVVVLGSMVSFLLGLYVLMFGLVGMQDTSYTKGIAIVIIALSSYLSIRSAIEMMS